MDTEAFFGRVVAPVGHLVLAALRASPTGSRFWNVGNYNAASAAQKVAALDNDPDITVYFAIGTHENNDAGKRVTRKKATAVWFKALALDLDCGPGKPYATQKDGAAALYTALAVFGFPDPLLVSSGNGLHAYWPLETAIPAARWEKVSIALRLALRDGGVQIDESKIHDASMVLRPVGSFHKKQRPWKTVQVLADCPDYSNLLLESKLQQWGGRVIPAKITPTSATAPRKPPSSLAANILSGGFDPLDIDALAQGCRQIEALLTSGGATDAAGVDVKEPMWRASLGVAKYAADSMDAVVRLCGQHPEFDLQANLDKMARWGGAGVTTCAQFEQHCPTGCAGCPSKGHIKSPAALNKQVALTVTVNTPADAVTGAAAFNIAHPPMKLPPGYFAANGKIWVEKEIEQTVDVAGKKQKTTVMGKDLVCIYPLVVFRWFADTLWEKSAIHWAVNYPIEGWREYYMPADALGTELQKYMLNKQIAMHDGMVNRLRTYMRDFLNYIQQNKAAGSEVRSFGWQPDGGFMHGKSPINVPGASWRLTDSLEKLSPYVCTHGDRATWTGITKLLDSPDAHLIAFSMLVAGSGLLMQGSGITSFVYSAFSEETGTGKTFSLQLGNTLFGHPDKLLLQPSDTENALYRTMGCMGSLSTAIDEITTMGEERASGFAFQAQTGREKLRMNSDASMRDTVHWHAPLRVSTNRSLLNLYDNIRVKNEAENARTLELRMDDKAWVTRNDVQALQRLLSDNHGFAVPEIAAEIMRRGTLREVYDATVAQFKREFPYFTFEGDERFYAAGIIAAYGIGRIGFDLGLFHFNIENCIDAVLSQVENLRMRRTGKRRDCFESIGEFIGKFSKHIVRVNEDRSNATAPRRTADPELPDTALIRMEIVYNATTPVLPGSKLMLTAVPLREWTKDTGEDYNGLIERLRNEGVVQDERARVSMYKETYRTVPGQVSCIVLDLAHPRLAPVRNIKPAPTTSTVVALLQGGKPKP